MPKTAVQTQKKKPKNSKAKGGAFERNVAKRLSLWYTHNERDDVFFRSASSGGRATQRFKKGQQTANSAGDLSYIDSVGEPFLKCVAVELKAGYKTATLSKLFSAKQAELLGFFNQASASATQAGVNGWMVVHKIDFQPEMVYMNMGLFNRYFHISTQPKLTDIMQFPIPVIFIVLGNSQPVACLKFDDFLTFDPKRFRPEVLWD